MEWREYVMDTYHRMRETNPHATLGEAMRASSAPWREMQHHLFNTRGALVERDRLGARHAKSPKTRQTYHQRAERIEATQYAELLKNMRHEDEWGQ